MSDKKLTNQEYKFASEMLWGGVPIDRVWAEGTNLFKSQAHKILEKYPMLDKSDFNIKRCKSFVKGLRTPEGILIYLKYRPKKLVIDRNEDDVKRTYITDKNNHDIHHVCNVKRVIYGYNFVIYGSEMDFTNSLTKGSKFI